MLRAWAKNRKNPMKTDKEYPATHSMWTAWFAIDKNGNVAIMECDDNGPAPIETPSESYAEELLVNSLISDDCRIRYTDEQLLTLMDNSITSSVYLSINNDYEYIFGSLCEIDPEKHDLLREAASLTEDNKILCISENLNLWYVYLSYPYYLDNSGDSRYRPTKTKIERNNLAKRLYKNLFEDNVIKRIVVLNWSLDYDEEEEYPGCIRHSDSPLNLYFQGYDDRMPSERMHLLPDESQVHESQLSESIKANAIRLPLSFKESDKIQLAQYVGVRFYGSNYDWEVDGQRAVVVYLTDGTACFVGNGCYFQPIPLDEAFKLHRVKYTPYFPEKEHEYKINGKRGYLKYKENQYYLVGSNEIMHVTKEDSIEIFEYGKD